MAPATSAAAAPGLFLHFDQHGVAVDTPDRPIASALSSHAGTTLSTAPPAKLAGRVSIRREGECFVVDGAGGPMACADDHVAVREVIHAATQLIVTARDDLLWLHAGVVMRDGRALLICGPSGQGKSTLVGRLAAAGWTYFSDEIAPVEAATASVRAFPLVAWRRVHEGGWIDDDEAVRALPKVPIDIGAVARSGEVATVAGICILEHVGMGRKTGLVACKPSEAVLELLRNSLNVGHPRECEIARLCSLVAMTDMARLTYANADDAATQLATRFA